MYCRCKFDWILLFFRYHEYLFRTMKPYLPEQTLDSECPLCPDARKLYNLYSRPGAKYSYKCQDKSAPSMLLLYDFAVIVFPG